MRILAALCLVPVLVACKVTVTKDDDTLQKVQQVERQRFAAMTTQNLAALEPLLADELYYGHSNGDVQTKQQFLEAIRSGQYRYESIDVHEFHARQYGDVTIAAGYISVRASVAGAPPMVLEIRYADAYVLRGGRWQLTTWQSTRLPATPR
ncbi:MAG TPA: nuclear transport factor 2 family protein [Steroidobacteraceae bacterium]|nr:nuclear transport factor 2 family protein [Steroidobacteraceae bacterium]